jgi:hypothetical protein
MREGLAVWRAEKFDSESELDTVAGRVCSQLSIENIEHDLKFVSVEHGWPVNELLVLTDKENEEIVGIAVFRIEVVPLVYALGPLTLFRWKRRRYRLHQGPISKRDDRARAIGSCCEALADSMPSGSVAFLYSVPLQSELQRQLDDRQSGLRRRFFALPWGPVRPYCLIRWHGSVEQYLAAIGRESRKDLKRSAKRLFSSDTLRCEVKLFQSALELDLFLRDGVPLSDRTWQKKKHGEGIAFGGPVERATRYAAKRGMFLGYILYINGTPAAFQVCYIYGKVCSMRLTGYDPAWATQQVGSVLFTEVMRDLERKKVCVDWLDFSAGANLFKHRTTTEKYPVRNYYLFKRNPMGAFQYGSIWLTDLLSQAAKRLLERFGLRRKSGPITTASSPESE